MNKTNPYDIMPERIPLAFIVVPLAAIMIYLFEVLPTIYP